MEIKAEVRLYSEMFMEKDSCRNTEKNLSHRGNSQQGAGSQKSNSGSRYRDLPLTME